MFKQVESIEVSLTERTLAVMGLKGHRVKSTDLHLWGAEIKKSEE